MVSFKTIINSLVNFKNALKNYPQFEKNYFELEKILKSSESPLKIMIMGEYSAGKSTFINALIGSQIADTSARESTAIITKFSYGKTDKIIAHMKDGTEQNINVSEFVNLTSMKDNEEFSFREKILFVERYFPAPILKNFTLIDSPGVEALEKDREVTTKNFLLNADALLWLVNAEQVGGKSDEMKHIENLPQRLKPIMVVNKMDTINEDEGDTPEDILNSYRQNFKNKVREFVGVSALQAIEGKLKNNPALLQESNLQEVIDTIDKIILPEFDEYKIKSLLAKFGLYLHQLEESIAEIEKRIEPLNRGEYLKKEFEKHSAAIYEVRQYVIKTSKIFYDYCQKPTTCAEIDFFLGILYKYGILFNKSDYIANRNFIDAANENFVEAKIILGKFLRLNSNMVLQNF